MNWSGSCWKVCIHRMRYLGLDRTRLTNQLVSDPRHKRYGQHLSAADVHSYVTPSNETSDLVHEWLAENGHSSESFDYSPAGDWVKLSLSVGEAENLLGTRYSVFRHVDGSELIRTSQWSLPSHLHDHIDAIQPTNSFFRFKPQAATWLQSPQQSYQDTSGSQKAELATGVQAEAIERVCNASMITPACLRTLYNTINYSPKAQAKSKIGYCNYLEETTITTDLSKYVSAYRPDASASTINFKTISNGENQQILDSVKQAARSDVEGNLDGQTITGMVYPMPSSHTTPEEDLRFQRHTTRQPEKQSPMSPISTG